MNYRADYYGLLNGGGSYLIGTADLEAMTDDQAHHKAMKFALEGATHLDLYKRVRMVDLTERRKRVKRIEEKPRKTCYADYLKELEARKKK